MNYRVNMHVVPKRILPPLCSPLHLISARVRVLWNASARASTWPSRPQGMRGPAGQVRHALGAMHGRVSCESASYAAGERLMECVCPSLGECAECAAGVGPVGESWRVFGSVE